MWRTERSLAHGSLISQMNGFYSAGNWGNLCCCCCLWQLGRGRKSWEWVSSRKIISEGRKPPVEYEKKKESPWKLRLKLGFAVTSSGSQAGSCGKGLRSLARSDGMYFVPGFAQIAHQEGQSPSVHAQSQPWVFW